MGFGEAVRTVYKDKYATFSGRASRSEYWYSFLFLLVVELVFFGLIFGLGFSAGLVEDFATGSLSGLMIALLVAFAIFFLAVLFPMIAVTVRRFHDRNMSGWWYLGISILSMIPYVGIAASIGLFVIMVLKGTPGDNRFGPDPLRGGASAEVFA